MKRSRFSEEQIIAVLKEQEAGMPTADVCRRHGISSATFSASSPGTSHSPRGASSTFTSASGRCRLTRLSQPIRRWHESAESSRL